jgi:two-component system, NarL family, response regulator LiaR
VEKQKDPAIIRVVVVDDHAIVRSGLAAFLHAFADLELVGEATDGAEAVQLCEGLCPDVVLMDLLMPGLDGATATALIRQRYPRIHVLILTSFTADELIQRALRAGAVGYLLKTVSAEELASAIRAAHRGRLTLAPEATQSLLRTTTGDAVPVPGNALTKREQDVLHLLTTGRDNKAIANALIISRSTVKYHLSNILSKLHAPNRTKAVAIALEHHLVP